MKKNEVKIFKFILIIIVIAIFVGMIAYLFPVIKNISTIEGQMAFKQKIDDSGIWGLLMISGLQIAQIFLIIIPGEPVEILAGMCYGSIWGTIFIMISCAIIAAVIFLLVRKFGRKFVYNFCDKEKISKIEKSKLFQNKKRIEMIVFMWFLIPGLPKDLGVYIAGLLPIKPVRFVVISTLARFPSIISSTLAGEHLMMGDWKMGVFLYAIVFLIVGIVIFIINKFDKDKTTNKIIDSMK